MNPGRTANIRINPKDCMSCIDVVQKTGVNLKGASFAMIVSAALSSLLESMRQNGIIPDRDGFEYAEMMRDYPMPSKGERARALAITKTFNISAGQMPAVASNPDMKRKKMRFDELAFKANNDAINMSHEEQSELTELTKELFPL